MSSYSLFSFSHLLKANKLSVRVMSYVKGLLAALSYNLIPLFIPHNLCWLCALVFFCHSAAFLHSSLPFHCFLLTPLLLWIHTAPLSGYPVFSFLISFVSTLGVSFTQHHLENLYINAWTEEEFPQKDTVFCKSKTTSLHWRKHRNKKKTRTFKNFCCTTPNVGCFQFKIKTP